MEYLALIDAALAVSALALAGYALVAARRMAGRDELDDVRRQIGVLDESVEGAEGELRQLRLGHETQAQAINGLTRRVGNAGVEAAELRRDLDNVAVKVQALLDSPSPSDDDGLAALRAEVEALRASVVDYGAEQPTTQMPHSHVWSAQAKFEDANSRTYACQVPYCTRVQTIAR